MFKPNTPPDEITRGGDIVHDQVKEFADAIKKATAAANAIVIVERVREDDNGTQWSHLVAGSVTDSDTAILSILADAYISAIREFVAETAADQVFDDAAEKGMSPEDRLLEITEEVALEGLKVNMEKRRNE